MQLIKEIQLNLDGGDEQVKVHVKQGDINSRLLKITLYEDGELYTIPQDATARFAWTKPDGLCVLGDASISDHVVLIELTQQMLASFGDATCEVMLYCDEALLTSVVFTAAIYPSAYDAGTVESTDEYNSFTNVMLGADGAIKRAESAAAEAEEATENLRDMVDGVDVELANMKDDVSQNTSGVQNLKTAFNQQGLVNGNLIMWDGSKLVSGVPAASVVQPNLLINSDFAINQRGQSSYSTAGRYTYDRWLLSTAQSVTRQANTCPDSNTQYMLNVAVKNNTYNTFSQPMENFSKRFVGKTVTVSFYIKAATNGTLVCGFGNRDVQTIQATTSWQKVVFTIPSVSAYTSEWNLNGFYMQTPIGETSGAIGSYFITGIQVVYGKYTGQYIPPDPSIELLRCQRFYQTNNGSTSQRVLISVNANGYAYGFVPFPVTMRTIPTMEYTKPSDKTGLSAADNGIDVNKGSLTANQSLEIRYTADAELYA